MILWMIGLAGSGKTTLGSLIASELKKRDRATVFLDGDLFRGIMSDDLGHTIEDRRINGERITKLCLFLDSQDINVVCSILSLFPKQRELCRNKASRYFEIFIDVSMKELIRRDQKGIYSEAIAGRAQNVVGVDIPFPRPKHPDMVIENSEHREDFSSIVTKILTLLDERENR